MKPLLVIMAHAGAVDSVMDFLPRWKALDCDLVFSLPCGDTLPIDEDICHVGVSAYAGYKVFDRFTLTLGEAILQSSGDIIIAEYDTVPLRPVLPKTHPGKLSSFYTLAPALDGSDQVQLCSLSPWVMTKDTAIMFGNACRESLKTDPDHPEGNGLLDRWIGKVINTHGILANNGAEMLGYPWHDGAIDRIRNMGYNWIHGWKRKNDFGDLWEQPSIL